MVSRSTVTLALAAAALASCKSSEPITDERPVRLLPSERTAKAGHTDDRPTSGIEWMHDDYPAALAKARKLGKPLVLDMWAPWCHTCISMQTTVLVDPGLAKQVDRFVWVGLDTEKQINAAPLAKFPVQTWPTFFVVSSENESIQARFTGAASIAQFREFLNQGEAGHVDTKAAAGKLREDSPVWQVRAGDRAAVAGDLKGADTHYARALTLAGPDWVRAPEVLVAQINARDRADDWSGCAELGAEQIDRALLAGTGSAADFAYYGNKCVGHLDKASQERVRRALAAGLDKLLAGDKTALSVDDHSEALRVRRSIAVGLGDTEGANTLARTQKALLDTALASARTPLEAMTYTTHRADVYKYLGIAEQLIPEVKKSIEDLPNQYDPPYRLAWIYYDLGRHDEALDMAKRALELLYGPRTGRVHLLIAEIHKARGDRAAERAAREAEVRTYEALPAGLKKPKALKKARKALAAMGKPNG